MTNLLLVQPKIHRTKTQTIQTVIDPAAKNIPFKGKLIWTYGLSFTIFPLFLASLIINNGHEPFNKNPLLGASPDSLLLLGGLNGERVRQGEWWRLFWSPYLHAGWIHFMLNWIVWFKIGEFVEPDWGFWRTFIIFVLSSFTGNLLSSTLDPNVVSVGASGGIFGIIGACIPYTIEYWDSIKSPKIVLFIIIFSMVVSLATGFIPYVDNYAHFGGAISGVLVGFASITRNGIYHKKKKEKFTENGAKKTSTTTFTNEFLKQDTVHPTKNMNFFKKGFLTLQKLIQFCWFKKNQERLKSYDERGSNPFQPDSNMSPTKNEESLASCSSLKNKCSNNIKLGNQSESVSFNELGKTPRFCPFDKLKKKQNDYVPTRLTLRTVPNTFIDNEKYEWCSCALWTIRGITFGIQIIIWLVLGYYLLICPECYNPPGQLFTSRMLEATSLSRLWSPLDYFYYQFNFPLNLEVAANFRGTVM